MTEECFTRVEALLGTKAACIATGRPRATHYRRVGRVTPNAPRPVPPNKLSKERVELVLSTLQRPAEGPPAAGRPSSTSGSRWPNGAWNWYIVRRETPGAENKHERLLGIVAAARRS